MQSIQSVYILLKIETDLPKYFSALRCIIRQAPHGATSHDLIQTLIYVMSTVIMNRLTVDATAAGTFAMIDITAFKFFTMKV